jgi:menaquinone-9 beta-reductase
LKRESDVFVIGGGPAGLAAAIAARLKGFSVTVADGAVPPIDKACGEGLLPEAQAALNDLGIEIPPQAGARFRGIRFLQDDAEVSADFVHGPAIGLRRPVLQELLLARAEQLGVDLLWNTPVIGIDVGGVYLADRTHGARWIIGADGSGSRVRQWMGLDAGAKHRGRFANRRHYGVPRWTDYTEVYWGSGAQAYVTPLGISQAEVQGEEEICVVLLGSTREDVTFENALSRWPELQERLAGAGLASRERGAMTSMHTLSQVQRGNIALLGDASGGIDAITGEGLRLAFRQALALSDALVEGDLKSYEEAHRRLARQPMVMGELLLLLARNDGLRGHVIRRLAAKPSLFARLMEIHTGEVTTAQLLATGSLLGWQLLAA